MKMFGKKPHVLDSMVDRMWAVGAGHEANEVFAAGATVLINAAAQMPQSLRSEAAFRLRTIADKIQNGEAFEKGAFQEESKA